LTTNFRCVKKNSFIEEPFAGVAQPVEQLICNQQVAGSSPIASSKREGFPSGQRGQTVNLLAQPSEVRILPPPPYSPEMVAEVKYAGIAQLVERQPSKLNVAGSSPVSRSKTPTRRVNRRLSPMGIPDDWPHCSRKVAATTCPRSSVGRALPW
jgi:hypothetical protein